MDYKQAVEHLAFDVHFFRSYARLDRLGLPNEPAIFRQAVRYCLLLHLRVLLDFFSKPPVKDDCCIADFSHFPKMRIAQDTGRLAPPADGRQLADNLNKRLAHFTATRWTDAAPAMEFYKPYIDHVDRLITEFECALPEELKSAFSDALRYWQTSHPIPLS